jgi:predicted RNase H-like nuclease (RuvC/YqgF family)
VSTTGEQLAERLVESVEQLQRADETLMALIEGLREDMTALSNRSHASDEGLRADMTALSNRIEALTRAFNSHASDVDYAHKR